MRLTGAVVGRPAAAATSRSMTASEGGDDGVVRSVLGGASALQTRRGGLHNDEQKRSAGDETFERGPLPFHGAVPPLAPGSGLPRTMSSSTRSGKRTPRDFHIALTASLSASILTPIAASDSPPAW